MEETREAFGYHLLGCAGLLALLVLPVESELGPESRSPLKSSGQLAGRRRSGTPGSGRGSDDVDVSANDASVRLLNLHSFHHRPVTVARRRRRKVIKKAAKDHRLAISSRVSNRLEEAALGSPDPPSPPQASPGDLQMMRSLVSVLSNMYNETLTPGAQKDRQANAVPRIPPIDSEQESSLANSHSLSNSDDTELSSEEAPERSATGNQTEEHSVDIPGFQIILKNIGSNNTIMINNPVFFHAEEVSGGNITIKGGLVVRHAAPQKEDSDVLWSRPDSGNTTKAESRTKSTKTLLSTASTTVQASNDVEESNIGRIENIPRMRKMLPAANVISRPSAGGSPHASGQEAPKPPDGDSSRAMTSDSTGASNDAFLTAFTAGMDQLVSQDENHPSYMDTEERSTAAGTTDDWHLTKPNGPQEDAAEEGDGARASIIRTDTGSPTDGSAEASDAEPPRTGTSLRVGDDYARLATALSLVSTPWSPSTQSGNHATAATESSAFAPSQGCADCPQAKARRKGQVGAPVMVSGVLRRHNTSIKVPHAGGAYTKTPIRNSAAPRRSRGFINFASNNATPLSTATGQQSGEESRAKTPHTAVTAEEEHISTSATNDQREFPLLPKEGRADAKDSYMNLGKVSSGSQTGINSTDSILISNGVAEVPGIGTFPVRIRLNSKVLGGRPVTQENWAKLLSGLSKMKISFLPPTTINRSEYTENVIDISDADATFEGSESLTTTQVPLPDELQHHPIAHTEDPLKFSNNSDSLSRVINRTTSVLQLVSFSADFGEASKKVAFESGTTSLPRVGTSSTHYTPVIAPTTPSTSDAFVPVTSYTLPRISAYPSHGPVLPSQALNTPGLDLGDMSKKVPSDIGSTSVPRAGASPVHGSTLSQQLTFSTFDSGTGAGETPKKAMNDFGVTATPRVSWYATQSPQPALPSSDAGNAPGEPPKKVAFEIGARPIHTSSSSLPNGYGVDNTETQKKIMNEIGSVYLFRPNSYPTHTTLSYPPQPAPPASEYGETPKKVAFEIGALPALKPAHISQSALQLAPSGSDNVENSKKIMNEIGAVLVPRSSLHPTHTFPTYPPQPSGPASEYGETGKKVAFEIGASPALRPALTLSPVPPPIAPSGPEYIDGSKKVGNEIGAAPVLRASTYAVHPSFAPPIITYSDFGDSPKKPMLESGATAIPRTNMRNKGGGGGKMPPTRLNGSSDGNIHDYSGMNPLTFIISTPPPGNIFLESIPAPAQPSALEHRNTGTPGLTQDSSIAEAPAQGARLSRVRADRVNPSPSVGVKAAVNISENLTAFSHHSGSVVQNSGAEETRVERLNEGKGMNFVPFRNWSTREVLNNISANLSDGKNNTGLVSALMNFLAQDGGLNKGAPEVAHNLTGGYSDSQSKISKLKKASYLSSGGLSPRSALLLTEDEPSNRNDSGIQSSVTAQRNAKSMIIGPKRSHTSRSASYKDSVRRMPAYVSAKAITRSKPHTSLEDRLTHLHRSTDGAQESVFVTRISLSTTPSDEVHTAETRTQSEESGSSSSDQSDLTSTPESKDKEFTSGLIAKEKLGPSIPPLQGASPNTESHSSSEMSVRRVANASDIFESPTHIIVTSNDTNETVTKSVRGVTKVRVLAHERLNAKVSQRQTDVHGNGLAWGMNTTQPTTVPFFSGAKSESNIPQLPPIIDSKLSSQLPIPTQEIPMTSVSMDLSIIAPEGSRPSDSQSESPNDENVYSSTTPELNQWKNR